MLQPKTNRFFPQITGRRRICCSIGQVDAVTSVSSISYALMNRLKATPGDQPSDKDNSNVATSSGHFVSPDKKQQEVSIEHFPREARHILVPIDLAQESLGTIRCAIRLGQHFGSRLTLLYVYQLPLAFGTTSGTYRNTELLQDRHEAGEMLKTQGASVRAAYPNCEWIMHSGDAGKGISDAALELGADLIVISSHHPIGTIAIARPILLIISCATRRVQFLR
jgi:nucleotide-binding universal stress UspA family protein